MYYLEKYFNSWIVKHSERTPIQIGPFMCEADAFFLVEMLNQGYIKLAGDMRDQEGFEDPYTVHKHA